MASFAHFVVIILQERKYQHLQQNYKITQDLHLQVQIYQLLRAQVGALEVFNEYPGRVPGLIYYG